MSKIHPLKVAPDQSTARSARGNSHVSAETESFTMWMKSLVMQTYGCTVFNDNGDVIYRVDNYEKRDSDEVYLMDVEGRVLFTILRQKRSINRQWKGYRCDDLEHSNHQKPFFNVRKISGILYLVTLGPGIALDNCYKLETSAGKSAFKILNNNGGVVAEAKRKQSCSGVQLGDDVLTLVVQPNVDHSLIMALGTVYGLLKHIL